MTTATLHEWAYIGMLTVFNVIVWSIAWSEWKCRRDSK